MLNGFLLLSFGSEEVTGGLFWFFKVNGVSPAATYFLCLAKESKQRKASLDAAPTLRAGVPDRRRCEAAAPLTRCAQTRGAQKTRLAPPSIGSFEWRQGQQQQQRQQQRQEQQQQQQQRQQQRRTCDVRGAIVHSTRLRDGSSLMSTPFEAAEMRVREADLLSAPCLSEASLGRGRLPHTHLGNRRPQDAGSIEARLSLLTFFGKTKKVSRRKAKRR
jgi:hypothetical protein